jgi:hypothetical protein
MGTTTFTGPVRSEGGFQVVSKNSTTGAYTDIATIASTGIVGDIGYEVGTSSSGAQIVAAITDEILDGGTTVVVGNVTTTTLVATTQNAATAPISAQYASAERTIYCNITNTVDATTAGSFTFIVEYVQIA